ncbi:AraC family transcriptional regulator [Calycomorphotria hydatis]|uniref:HTH-type transcriptional activator RhaR n=1 Tax=Calycomorphotria hydatis TaxID=2528027 RepID=A0A517T8X9_9PLAN|nr:AraC family transcriptional regulator [Calycomorphotria hydatis]QDT64826.1 HTH-type transcriptional activator RhaR [Calycomorphotria hydatis]
MHASIYSFSQDIIVAKPLTSTPVQEEIPDWGIAVFESHHASDFVMTPRSHNFHKFVYIVAGAGELHIDQTVARCAVHSMIAVPPGCRNWIIDDPPNPITLYALCIDSQRVPHAAPLLNDLGQYQKMCPPSLAGRLESRWRRLLYYQSWENPYRPAAVTSAAIDLLLQLTSATPENDEHQTDELLGDYLTWLSANFFEPMTIDEAAAMTGRSRRSFTSAFKSQTGQSWLNYLQALRVEHACHLLRDTNRTIASIAFESGFEELSSFYRVFKKLRSASPGEWREQHAED